MEKKNLPALMSLVLRVQSLAPAQGNSDERAQQRREASGPGVEGQMRGTNITWKSPLGVAGGEEHYSNHGGLTQLLTLSWHRRHLFALVFP